MPSILRFCLGLSALTLGAATAWAAGLEDLENFMSRHKNLGAHFEQTVRSASGKQVKRASGSMLISRPGKFRWQIESPYPQLIVGNGKKIWVYDPELKQVSIRQQSAALNGTPAALLTGRNDLVNYFTLINAGTENAVNWVEALPKQKDTGFDKIRLGFAAGNLVQMEMDDSFGQHTSLKFSRPDNNPALSADTFNFSPPAGVDVLGE